jgi:transposase InsO family protein
MPAAVAESFFATIKKELVHRESWPSRRDLSSAVFEHIEAFYNRQRRPPPSDTSPQRSSKEGESGPRTTTSD